MSTCQESETENLEKLHGIKSPDDNLLGRFKVFLILRNAGIDFRLQILNNPELLLSDDKEKLSSWSSKLFLEVLCFVKSPV